VYLPISSHLTIKAWPLPHKQAGSSLESLPNELLLAPLPAPAQMQSHHPPPEEGVGEDEDVDAMVMEEDGVERPCLEVKFSFLEWLPP